MTDLLILWLIRWLDRRRGPSPLASRVRIDDIRQDPDGYIALEFSFDPPGPGFQRLGRRWRNVAHLQEWIDQVGQEELLETLLRMMLARWRNLNPAMNNPTLIEGKTATFDSATNNIVVLA